MFLPKPRRAETLHVMKGVIGCLAVSGLLAQAACTLPATERSAIRITNRSTLQNEPIGGSHGASAKRLDLTLVYFDAGAWPREAIVDTTRAAAQILKQCDVVVTRQELLRVEAPSRYQFFDTPVSRALARSLDLAKPTVYFVSDTRQEPAFDAEAIGRANSATRPELADTVWVTRATRDPGVALAHELVHVLTDSGEHADQPDNLMREETSPSNTRLTPAQCTAIRTVGTENGLLRGPP